MRDFYLLTTAVIYVFASIFIYVGKPDLGIDPKYRALIACVIFFYGSFRLYHAYRRLRSKRENENQ